MFRKKQTPATTSRRVVQRQSAAPVFSYHANRAPAETSTGGRRTELPAANKPRTHSVKRLLLYVPTLLAGVVLAGCLLYGSTLSTTPKIQVVQAGQEDISLLADSQTYEAEARAILERSVFNRSKLLMDSNKVAGELQDAFPELGHVSVIIPLSSRRPIIEVRPAHPALIISGNGGAFVVDQEGRVVIRASDVDSSVRDPLPVIQDESGLPIEKGKGILPTETIAFIREVAGQLAAKQIKLQSMTLPATANELHVRPEGKPYLVKFDVRGEGRLQVGTFVAVKENLEQSRKTPAEYIDVRVPEKAFYK